jgi:hypothetical protein
LGLCARVGLLYTNFKDGCMLYGVWGGQEVEILVW